MGLVSDGCQDSGSDRMSYWRPFLKVGSCIMGFPTSRVYCQCAKIYSDHWEAYAAVLPTFTTSACGERKRIDELH